MGFKRASAANQVVSAIHPNAGCDEQHNRAGIAIIRVLGYL